MLLSHRAVDRSVGRGVQKQEEKAGGRPPRCGGDIKNMNQTNPTVRKRLRNVQELQIITSSFCLPPQKSAALKNFDACCDRGSTFWSNTFFRPFHGHSSRVGRSGQVDPARPVIFEKPPDPIRPDS